ncbi:MAG: hypothetical protein JOZ24_11765, partial [Candidatus Eremiobacteraeota bacterium]|nr:hypothetical protein [Candidatus Eremiobacteraeota bacterium]
MRRCARLLAAVFGALAVTGTAVFVTNAPAPARDINPGVPLADVPSFSVTVPNFASSGGQPISVTFAGSITAKTLTPPGVPCASTVEYDAKVTLTPSASPPNIAFARPVSYSWAPSKSLAGAYDVNNAPSGQGLLSVPLVSSAMITYKASSPAEGSPVTFLVDFGPPIGKQMLRVVSHVQCPAVRHLVL